MRKLLLQNFMTRVYINDSVLSAWIFIAMLFVALIQNFFREDLPHGLSFYTNISLLGLYILVKVLTYVFVKSDQSENQKFKTIMHKICHTRPIYDLIAWDNTPFKRTMHYAEACSQGLIILWLALSIYNHSVLFQGFAFIMSIFFFCIDGYFKLKPMTFNETMLAYRINGDEVRELIKYKNDGWPDVNDSIELERVKYLVNLYVCSGHLIDAVQGMKEWYEYNVEEPREAGVTTVEEDLSSAGFDHCKD